jgi:Fe(3+) dicitrate transport protein
VLFDKPTNIMDTINTATMQYNHRQVDIDRFNSYTTELRLLQHYRTGQQQHALTAGIQYMNNDLHRTQQGKGTTGSDFDLSLVNPVWGRDLHFKTTNLAMFAENRFALGKGLTVTAGARIETGRTDMSGQIQYYPAHKIPLSIQHRFPLLGAGIQYKVNEQVQFYGGWSQSYRPMIFKDLVSASLYEQVDPDIKDAHGYNAEIGFKGSWSILKWDVTAFLLREKNRFGTLAQTDAANNLVTYRTNIGDSRTKGLEMLIEANWRLNRNTALTLFTATSFMQARYLKATVKNGGSNVDVTGNKVESAPDFITRNGATIHTPMLSVSLLHSYVSSTFADALNTVTPPPATGAVGLVPAYGLLDLNSTVRISKKLSCKINVNNLLNKQYFTKRPLFYPGPGIWPSEGRNWSVSLAIKL